MTPRASPLVENDNGSNGPTSDDKDATIDFTPSVSGTYFLAAAANGGVATGTYTLVTRVDDGPPDRIDAVERRMSKRTSRPGTAIGTLIAHDPDSGDTLSLSLVGNPGGHFAIAGDQLIVVVPLDFETAASYPVTRPSHRCSSARPSNRQLRRCGRQRLAGDHQGHPRQRPCWSAEATGISSPAAMARTG